MAFLESGNWRVVAFARTCLGCCTNAARASRKTMQIHQQMKRHTVTARKWGHRMVTWNARVLSRASLEAWLTWLDVAGGAPGC